MIHRLFLTLALCFTASVALAFPIDLDFDPRGLDVVAEPFAQGPVALVRVVNGEDFPVICRAVFRNGPEASRQRQAIVAPGDSTTISWTARRQVVRLRVGLHCERHE
ncbi:hypothetical protein [Thioalkalivibrio sp. XN8]|uniref:hypothetical protein n=1 Tax=Thioalkalivibrio sp. XN8 TaxID=2712863 RepID=UPI0013EE086C|nr:hypothetical protein [Thioalkalivibrio sp. XN8]NGP53452.1 hypothetical protein [Thioalkalivibrio sp. XN8]